MHSLRPASLLYAGIIALAALPFECATAQTADEICVTDRVNMPYIFVLFANATDPRVFLRSVRYANPGAEFQHVVSFDRYRFGLQNCSPSARVLIATHEEARHLELGRFSRQPFELYTVLERR